MKPNLLSRSLFEIGVLLSATALAQSTRKTETIRKKRGQRTLVFESLAAITHKARMAAGLVVGAY